VQNQQKDGAESTENDIASPTLEYSIEKAAGSAAAAAAG
jgi:hypothetical protein